MLISLINLDLSAATHFSTNWFIINLQSLRIGIISFVSIYLKAIKKKEKKRQRKKERSKDALWVRSDVDRFFSICVFETDLQLQSVKTCISIFQNDTTQHNSSFLYINSLYCVILLFFLQQILLKRLNHLVIQFSKFQSTILLEQFSMESCKQCIESILVSTTRADDTLSAPLTTRRIEDT